MNVGLKLKTLEQVMKRVVILDVDRTLHPRVSCLSLLDELVSMGAVAARHRSAVRGPHVAYHMGRSSHARMTELTTRVCANVLAAVDEDLLASAARQVWAKERRAPFAFVGPLLTVLRSHAVAPVIVSGSPAAIVSVIAHDLGVHEVHAAVNAKKDTVKRILASHAATGAGCFAVGGTGGDVDALEQVEHAIAYEPDREFLSRAGGQGWPVADRGTVHELVKERLHQMASTDACTAGAADAARCGSDWSYVSMCALYAAHRSELTWPRRDHIGLRMRS
ncbi:haloacid dehalogenase-like hydrolase [Lentzea sp. NPDC051208]|uniref:haloacid dehalogenase-like hydrolase n=1 Tax=Lentzea sp. NPDC051208 TaxID=3154642 RepID=UPI00343F8015